MTSGPLSLRAFVRRFFVALVVGVVLTVALVVTGNKVESAKISRINKADIDPRLLTEGGNYLIIGSDSRAFVSSSVDASQFGSRSSELGQRSDTMMIAHIDPGKHTGVLVSFPRDLWVPIPGHGTAKINAAFAFGGPQLTISTIRQDFNIPISHYLEVDFSGFREIVNAIGSVPIFFPTPARDFKTGLKIKHPGCRNLAGNDALRYVRSRHYEYQSADGQWHDDPTADIGRIRRQQYFIRSLSKAAIKTVFPDPLRFNNVLDKIVESLTSDKKFGASDLRALVRAFRNTNPNAFPMYTLPADNAFRDSQSVLLLDDAEAAPMLARLRGAPKHTLKVPHIAPATVGVTVQNGSGVGGAAARALTTLAADGFALGVPATDADRSDYPVTEVRYGPGAGTKAQLVLAYLGGAGSLVPLDAAPSGEDVIVVLGRDFQQVVAPGASATATSGARGTAAPSGTTSTTGPAPNPGGVVPEAGC